jgi:oligopeptide transport system substrate-binding protein
VPLRGVLEKMGARVFWDEPTHTMIVQRKRTEIRFPADGFDTINGDQVVLDTPALLADGRVIVPLRFLAENLGAQVSWDRREREVPIRSSRQVSSVSSVN